VLSGVLRQLGWNLSQTPLSLAITIRLGAEASYDRSGFSGAIAAVRYPAIASLQLDCRSEGTAMRGYVVVVLFFHTLLSGLTRLSPGRTVLSCGLPSFSRQLKIEVLRRRSGNRHSTTVFAASRLVVSEWFSDVACSVEWMTRGALASEDGLFCSI
jgi:hypothetical protein